MNYPSPHYRVLRGVPKYKYELLADYHFRLEDPMRHDASGGISPYLVLDRGNVTARVGYRWDGPSGPVIHTTSWVRAALVHDVLYQLMRLGWLSTRHRRRVDALMYELARDDGMPWWRAWYSWIAVRLFGGRYAKPDAA